MARSEQDKLTKWKIEIMQITLQLKIKKENTKNVNIHK